MIKLIFAFVVFFTIFYFMIQSIHDMTGKERWKLTKYIGYSILCSVLTISSLIAITILF